VLFDELVLFNIGVYRGEHRLQLTPDDDKPVVLIGGLNGGGKTTILDALQLVLYGKRARCSNRGSLAYDEFLRRTISRGAPDDEGAAIELLFRVHIDGDERTYRVHRSFVATGRSIREDLTVRRDGQFDPILTENWDDHLEELLPLEVASLFFFDGEKIEALADPAQAGAVIGAAIRSLFGLHLVDRLQSDLVALERRKRSEHFDETAKAELAQLEGVLAAHEEHRESAFLARAAARTAVDRAQLRADRADAAYRTEGGDLYEAREDLAARRAAAADALKTAEVALRDVAAGALPLLLVEPLLRAVEREADAADGIDPQRLAGLLAERDEQLVALLEAKRTRKAVIDAAVAHLATDRERRARAAALHSAAAGAAAWRAIANDLPDAQAATKASQAELETRRADLDHLDRQIGAIPSADALGPALAERTAALAALHEVTGALGACEDDLASCTRLRDDAARRLDQAMAATAEARLARDDAARVAEHAARVRDTLDALRARVIARHAATIETAILDSLNRLLHKQRLVSDLRLDRDSFGVALYDDQGDELPAERLSAGERQLLAVAILWGLAKVSGRRLPTVIDTPLGRLDSEHRRRLVDRYFPYAAQQVVLLSTDEEIDEDLLARLDPHVGRTYRLTTAADGTTTITDAYFWERSSADVA
jgi:DNA sulfur modification protein DndD